VAEALVCARPELLGVDPGTGAAWRWVVGHVVAVQDDGFAWGALEDPRNFATAAQRRFALFRFPGVTIARVSRYLANQIDVNAVVIRNRVWQIQWSSLPLAARNILTSTGVLTIGGPTGDFTWAQVQAFVLNLQTGLTDTDPLI
jgi:hypothetical protein